MLSQRARVPSLEFTVSSLNEKNLQIFAGLNARKRDWVGARAEAADGEVEPQRQNDQRQAVEGQDVNVDVDISVDAAAKSHSLMFDFFSFDLEPILWNFYEQNLRVNFTSLQKNESHEALLCSITCGNFSQNTRKMLQVHFTAPILHVGFTHKMQVISTVHRIGSWLTLNGADYFFSPMAVALIQL